MSEHRSNPHPHGLLQSALRYIRLSWAVLPLYAATLEGCSCSSEECPSPGKHPLTKNGLKDASVDPDVVERRWAKWPNANIGIRTGAQSGIVVLDIDPKHGGDESLAELERINGPLPDTVEQKTGGGGRHFFFTHPGRQVKNRVGIFPGLDLRGDGGYVVASPSIHASGQPYEWVPGRSPEEIEVAPMPSWLLEPDRSGRSSSETSDGEGEVRWCEGERNTRLTSVAGKLRRDRLSAESILEVLLQLNDTACTPSLPETEVRRIAEGMERYPPELTLEELLVRLGIFELDRNYAPERLQTMLERVAQWRNQKPPSALEEALGAEVRRVLRKAKVDRPAAMWDSTAPAAKKRKNEGKGSGSSLGTQLALADPDPWDQPVSGEEILQEVETLLQRHLVLPECALSANVHETRSTQRIRVGRRQRNQGC